MDGGAQARNYAVASVRRCASRFFLSKSQYFPPPRVGIDDVTLF
jgi:hypothetical protein